IINQGHGLNFNDYINQFRVEEFKRLLQDPQFSKETLLAVAFEAGFNSKTTFNTAFKKFTGMTPSEYRRSLNV
ncbi:MAG: helix-turn-helix domain-containing protein, partial [Marinifilaceae bacterium]